MRDLLIALAGALTGGVIGFWVSRAATKDQFFYAASTKLKEAFIDVLRSLILPEDQFVDIVALDCMDECFSQHERAVIEFRYALPIWQRPRFDAAWENYKGKETGVCKLSNKYADIGREIILSDIEAILEFTKPPTFPFLVILKYKLRRRK